MRTAILVSGYLIAKATDPNILDHTSSTSFAAISMFFILADIYDLFKKKK